MRSAVLLLICFISSVFASVYQLPLRGGVWHLVGVNGFHGSAMGFENGWATLKRQNGDHNFAWDQSDEILSSIGLRILPTDSNLSKAVISYETLSKDSDKAMLGMFVSSAGAGRKADLEIRFQADYKGRPFHIQFDNGLVMQGKFDPKYTRGTPANLELRIHSPVSRIIDLIDANLNDNNVSALDHFTLTCKSLYCVNDTIRTGGRQMLLNGAVTAYSWSPSSQTWATYDSRKQNNDFDSFEAGRAYWIRIDAPADVNAGLILATSELSDETYASNVQPRWNMLSFNDGFLRNAPGAVFIPEANLSGLRTRDNFAKNEISVSKSDPIAAAREFNAKIRALDISGENAWKIRAYPAENAAGDNGIVLISDEDFGVALEGLKTIANQDFYQGAPETTTFNMTRTDEHILALRLNEALFDAQTLKHFAMQIGFAGDNLISSIDLSAASAAKDVLSVVNALLASHNASTKSGAVLIDADFDGSSETLLIAANKRVYARDATFSRLFDYNSSFTGETFLLRGVSDALIEYGSPIVDQINYYANVTGVNAYVLPSNRVLLSSIALRDFELKELGARAQFNERYLYEEDSSFVKGAIDEVYSHFALANAAIKEDGTPYQATVLTDDLNFVAQFSADFPVDGALYNLQKAGGGLSAPDIILSGVTRDDDTILWRQADLTVPVDSQREAFSRFNLYKLRKDRGYWVYMREYGAQNAITSGATALQSKITQDYSNIFDGAGSNAISKTRNNISLDISIDANGLSGLYANQIEMPENVFLHIDAQIAPLLKNGASHNYYVSLDGRDLSALSEKPFNAPQMALGLYMTSGLGAKLSDERIRFDNRKPRAIEFAFDTIESGGYRGGLRLKTNEASKIYIYEGNLSDNGNNPYLIYFGDAIEKLNLLNRPEILYDHNKPYYDLRMIGEASNKLQSDVRRIFYAPLYRGTHLLSSNRITDENETNATPIAFSLDGQNHQRWADNFGAPTDSGVQLSLSAGEYNATDSNTTALIYYPRGLTLFSGTPVSSELILDGDNVGKIVYTTSWQGDLFYFYHKERNKLAYGRFLGSDADITLVPIDSDQTIIDPRREPLAAEDDEDARDGDDEDAGDGDEDEEDGEDAGDEESEDGDEDEEDGA
ncbi:MAG: hypothetical protein LBI57_08430 [Helicobacteraceae bacterium]|jgi:hypothetical protein|nr:hypothetical protein [Helicobacteraceae bacterium]